MVKNNDNMKFINLNDINARIKDNILSDCIDNNSEILDSVEDYAINVVAGYTGMIYDIPFEIRKIESERSGDLISFILDIMLFDLHSRLSVTGINDLVEVRYEKCIELLKLINKGVYAPANWKIKDFKFDDTVLAPTFGSDCKSSYTW